MTNQADIPPPLPWEQRSRTVGTMPGGNSNYVETLRDICEHVIEHEPTFRDLVSWLQDRYDLKGRTASYRGGLLLTAGILDDETGVLRLSKLANRWYSTQDDGILIAQLHSQLQFMGELLPELDEKPRSAEELRSVAGNYGLNWTKRDQVGRRRMWLQSAEMIMTVRDGRIALTEAGRDLLSNLEIHQPPGHTSRPRPIVTPTPPETDPEASSPGTMPSVATTNRACPHLA